LIKTKRQVPPQLEWMNCALPGRIQLHTSGDGAALIENFVCVEEFLPERVKIAGASGSYTINGSDLVLSEVRPGSLIIRGGIREIIFPGERCNA